MRREQRWARGTVFLVLLLVAVVGASGATFAAEVVFKDAPAGDHWAAPAVTELGLGKLLIGYPDGSFRGDQATTRYELAMALSRLYGLVREVMKRETADPQALAQLAEDVRALEKASAAGRTEAAERLATQDAATELLRKSLVQTANQVAQLVGELAGLRTADEGLAAGAEALGLRMSAAEERADALAKGVDALDRRLAALEVAQAQAQAETQTQAQVSSSEVAETRRKLQELADQVQREFAEITGQYGERLAKQEAAIELLRESLAQTEDQMAQLVTDLAEGRKLDEDTAAQVAELRTALETLGAQLAEVKAADEAPAEEDLTLTRRLEDLDELLRALEEDKASSVEVAELQGQFQEFADQVQQQLAEVTGEYGDRLVKQETATELLRKSLAQTADQVARLVTDLAEGRKLDEDTAAQVAELRTALETLGAQLAEVKAAGDALTEEGTAFSRRLEDLDELLRALEEDKASSAEVAELQGQFQQFAGQAQQQSTALETLRQNLAQTTDRVAQLEGDLAEGRKVDEDTLAQLAELRKSLETAGSQLAELKQGDEVLVKRLTSVEGRTDDLVKGTTDLTGRVQQTQQGLDDLRQRAETLEGEVQKLKEGQRRLGWLIALGAAAIAVF